MPTLSPRAFKAKAKAAVTLVFPEPPARSAPTIAKGGPTGSRARALIQAACRRAPAQYRGVKGSQTGCGRNRRAGKNPYEAEKVPIPVKIEFPAAKCDNGWVIPTVSARPGNLAIPGLRAAF
jgi:hypothetical protein